VLSEEDVRYVRDGFVPLVELCAERALSVDELRGSLPAATYVLEDGTQMVPRDYFRLLDEAGSVGAVRREFERRFLASGGDPGAVEEEWAAYLSGEYGACLRNVTPETIVRKEALVREVDELLSAPEPVDAGWLSRLRAAVDDLDSLERPFAAYDRLRFGGPVSRDRCVSGPRERYPQAWA
jgi:hypothetical protein